MIISARILLPKILIFTILFLLILVSAFTVLAEDATSPGTTKKEEAKMRKDERKDVIEAKKDLAQTRLQNLKERIASKGAALKERLKTFKDQKKAQIAERINNNLNKINELITNNMRRHLEKMTKILEKLTNRVEDGKPDIKNADLAKQAIASASAAIASVSAAVDTQAEKDYTIEATSEATIKEDARTMRRQLHNDLQKVRRLVIAAKQSVANAIRVAKSGKMEKGKEATESGQ